MHPTRSKVNTIEEYLALFPVEIQIKLIELRDFIKKLVPNATEAMSYAIPTFKLNGKNLVHFAGYEHHIGFYPGAAPIAEFKSQLSAFHTAKGSVQFPLDQTLPYDLIQEMVKFAIQLNTAKNQPKSNSVDKRL